MLKIEIVRNRLCIATETPFDSVVEKAEAAYEAGLLLPQTQYFLSSTSNVFLQHDGETLRTYRLRDNGNGWHDLALYSLPSFEDVGQTFPADSNRGQHRDVVTLRKS